MWFLIGWVNSDTLQTRREIARNCFWQNFHHHHCWLKSAFHVPSDPVQRCELLQIDYHRTNYGVLSLLSYIPRLQRDRWPFGFRYAAESICDVGRYRVNAWCYGFFDRWWISLHSHLFSQHFWAGKFGSDIFLWALL
jgi:hypothetical protein